MICFQKSNLNFPKVCPVDFPMLLCCVQSIDSWCNTVTPLILLKPPPIFHRFHHLFQDVALSGEFIQVNPGVKVNSPNFCEVMMFSVGLRFERRIIHGFMTWIRRFLSNSSFLYMGEITPHLYLVLGGSSHKSASRSFNNNR